MSNPHELEEEEFTTQFNGRTLQRIFAQVKPYWPMLVGFVLLIAVAAFLDSLFTYMSKLLIDDGIVAGDRNAVTRIIAIYGSLIVVQSLTVFGFIYITGLLGERVGDRA